MAAATVALTFDDGPGPHTIEVLEVLAAAQVRATFFVTGAHVAARPDLAARIVAAGHLIGNHTYTHPQDIPGSEPRGNFDALAEDVQAAQLDDTTLQIVAATGVPPAFFRGPGGWHGSELTRRLCAERDMVVCGWTADTGDWNAPAELSTAFQDAMLAVIGRVTESARDPAPGGHQVVLMHDAKASAEPDGELPAFRGNTVAALPRVIDTLRAAGFGFTDPLGRAF
jgi:peptidoglycan/xylan/chitin deacetylase (PgdA/CDA1 family)